MIFDGLRAMARRTDPANPQHGRNQIVYSSLPIAGVNVSNHTALCIASVWECVRIISETLAMLPWRVFEMTNEGSSTRRRIMTESPLDFVLHKRPNAEMPAFIFKEVIQAHALLWGNGYAEIERPRGLKTGPPVALHLITPDLVEPKRTARGSLFYEVRDEAGGIVELGPEKMFHVRGLSWSGHAGYNLVSIARETLATALATEQFTSAFFGNGAHLGGVIQAPAGMKDLGEEAVKNMMGSFNKRHRGARNSGKTQYLDKGMEFKEVGVNPNDAQLIEAKKFNVLDVARWFRMPPHKLAHLDSSIKANIEAQGIEFVTDTMLPWVLRWEHESDFKFFDRSELGKQFTKMDLNMLLRGDSAGRGTFYKTMTGIGAFSINEVRVFEDMDTIGPDGDLRLVPMNMVSLDEANRNGSTGMTRTRSTDAHISVFEDVISRMTRKECKAIGAKSGLTHEQFAEFAQGFYAVHNKQLTQALLRPALALAEFVDDEPDQMSVGESVENFVSKHCREAEKRAIESAKGGQLKQFIAVASADVHGVAVRIASIVTDIVMREETG